jgi:lysophospholipase L1-like esterase
MGAQIVFDGDSLVVGDHPWHNPAWLTVERLCRAGHAIDRVRNVAAGGQTMAGMDTAGAATVDALYSGSYSANILVVLGGTNDIATAGNVSAATLIASIEGYCTDRQSAGWQVVISTLLPRTDAGAGVNHESRRATVNASIVTNHATYADALADLAANSAIGQLGDEAVKDYYSDLLHLNRNGWHVVADIWVPLIEGLL